MCFTTGHLQDGKKTQRKMRSKGLRMGKVNGLEVEAPAETDVVPKRLRDPSTTPTSKGWVTVYAKWG